MRRKLLAAIIVAGISLAALLYLASRPAVPAFSVQSNVMTIPVVEQASVPATTEAITFPPTTEQTQLPDPIAELAASMTLEEKVGQLFLARCPETDGAGEAARFHLGGYLLFGRDFENQTPDSVRQTIASYQEAAKIPLLIAVDEEGGTVCRVSCYRAFRSERFASPRQLYSQGGMELVLSTETEKARLLKSLGVNVNMAPVCDITTQSSAFMYQRSLGQSPEIVGDFVSGTIARMAQEGVGAVMKHFPGYGNNSDTHTGIAVDRRSLTELESMDMQPFFSGIWAGGGAILVSHTIVEAIDEDYPASLSAQMHRYLRLAMDFDGVIMTDDLSMEAITDRYGAGEAAVLAVLAGNDLLCSTEYAAQYEAVLEACKNGRISPEVLNEAVRHVLRWKKELNLL